MKRFFRLLANVNELADRVAALLAVRAKLSMDLNAELTTNEREQIRKLIGRLASILGLD